MNKTDPFEWTISAPAIKASELGDNDAVSLNPLDLKMIALNFTNTKLPAVTGYDVRGRIIAVGKGVKNFKVGDEVFEALNIDTGNGGGTLQQYSAEKTDALVKKTANITLTDATTLATVFLSAMDGLHQINIDSSTTDFISGGSSSAGHFALQIARIRGEKQINQYQNKDVIDHGKENVIDRVLELTGGKGVDIIYDSTDSELNFEKSITAVNQSGSWIVLSDFAREDSQGAKNSRSTKSRISSC